MGRIDFNYPHIIVSYDSKEDQKELEYAINDAIGSGASILSTARELSFDIASKNIIALKKTNFLWTRKALAEAEKCLINKLPASNVWLMTALSPQRCPNCKADIRCEYIGDQGAVDHYFTWMHKCLNCNYSEDFSSYSGSGCETGDSSYSTSTCPGCDR